MKDLPKMKVVNRAGKGSLVIRWKDPETGLWRERSSGTRRRRDAERVAAKLAAEIAQGCLDSGEILWDNFRTRYEREKMSGLSAKTLANWRTAANWLEEIINPVRLLDVNASVMSRFAAALRERDKPETTIAAYLRPIKAALRWAEEIGLLSDAPRIKMPKRARGVQARARPVTGEEFERILAKVPSVRPDDAPQFERFIRGLWHSGMRVAELCRLSWDTKDWLSLQVVDGVPLIRMLAEGHKAHRDQWQPITPQFWRIASESEDRVGLVFPLVGTRGRTRGQQMTHEHIGRQISAIGKKAGVVTNSITGKCASSSDVGRRAFSTRMSETVSAAELNKWANHASIQTTMAYYCLHDAKSLARKAWQGLGDPLGDPVDKQALREP